MPPASRRPGQGLFIGAPVRACDRWRGRLFTSGAPRREWLRQYSSVFNTVEGNSTFYGLPAADTVRRWADESVDGFRFALKFPRVISHDRRLRKSERETAAFLDVVRILADANRLGPSFLQLPPDFGPSECEWLDAYLSELPPEFPWAVEVRDHAWYDAGPHESALDGMLRERQIDKVLFDSRPLYARPPSDEAERISQTRKPRTPIRQTVTGRHPFLRIVGRNTVVETRPLIAEWAPVVAGWLRSGLTPFLFTHTPDDRFAPEFAQLMHDEIRAAAPGVPALPPWPGESAVREHKTQGLLF